MTTEELNYTPKETDKNTALAVIGWALREDANMAQTLAGRDDFPSLMAGPLHTQVRHSAEVVIQTIQAAWDRYLERVGRG